MTYRERLAHYEQIKERLRKAGLSPEEYNKEIKKAAKELDI